MLTPNLHSAVGKRIVLPSNKEAAHAARKLIDISEPLVRR